LLQKLHDTQAAIQHLHINLSFSQPKYFSQLQASDSHLELQDCVGLTDGTRSSTVYHRRGSAENVGVGCAGADGTLPENSYSPASPVQETETLCKTLADETRGN